MMVPAQAGWEPDSDLPGGVPPEALVVVNNEASVLLPLLGLAGVIAAAYFMERAGATTGDEDEDDVVEEITEIDDDDDDSDFDDYDEDDEDEDDDED